MSWYISAMCYCVVLFHYPFSSTDNMLIMNLFLTIKFEFVDGVECDESG